MKSFGMAILSAVVVAVVSAAVPVRAADDGFGFSFDATSVRFGYADGYWDNDHHWHGWPSAREAREFHRRFSDRVYGYRHTRYPSDGWREGNMISAPGREEMHNSRGN